METKIKTHEHKKFITKDYSGNENGFLVPILNIHDNILERDQFTQQVYLSTVLPNHMKGPHLHNIRSGYFTCIRGNVKIVLKVDGKYLEYFSGEDYNYLSVQVPKGIPALVVCLGEIEAYLLNMPSPAWTPDMNDEHTSDFSDYFANL